jgi:hypothetical protein
VGRRHRPDLARSVDGGRRDEGQTNQLRVKEPRLLRLVRAQHRQDVSRASLPRDTKAWEEATTRLEALNDQVFYAASTGVLPRESLGYELDLELDSRPEEDLAFRDSVVASVRGTVLARVRESLAAHTRDRVRERDTSVRATRFLMDRVEANLRTQYPNASFDARAFTRGTISLIAARDGVIG